MTALRVNDCTVWSCTVRKPVRTLLAPHDSASATTGYNRPVIAVIQPDTGL
jgi:hypothetical protein